MGNILSSASTIIRATEDVTSESETMDDAIASRVRDETDEQHGTSSNDNQEEARAKAKEKEMDEFKKQLNIKREQRKEILARHRAEKVELEKTLQEERKCKLDLYENNMQLRELLVQNNIEIPEKLQSSSEYSELTNTVIQMRQELEELQSNSIKLRRDLVDSNNALQGAYSDIADLNAQNMQSMVQINALKEVVTVSKTLISLREQQLDELKSKLNDIETSLADRETSLLSTNLRQEYERQLQNIRTLRGLYDERARLAEVTRQGLINELEEHKVLYQAEVNKCKALATRIEELEANEERLKETISHKNDQISSYKDETNGLKAEMTVVNKLFSQVLLGYKTKQDLDKLIFRLEENHGLLTHMAERENGSEASSALPKLLLQLVSQVDESEENKYCDVNSENESQTIEQNENSIEKIEPLNATNATAEEIVENLSKVWRVLMELLSHQNVTDDNSEKVTTCYKSVETKSGPVLVPSVSQTYIRLKDLILEKLGLIKEVNHMKQLNTHLETRLEEQEKRLCLVTTELSKTWHVVGRLRKHHHQLHTHEKILKYELQQKRKLLNELKEELEYCREKWEQAREKNTQSERDWRKLRTEFSSRKTKSDSPSFNNSAESGYSDERPSEESSESNDESEYVAEPMMRCKKKMKKSFETIFDSSTDFNLAAEREDPASDMLDVAELPLDTQEGDDNQEVSFDSTKTENIVNCEKMCEETEDEIGDIAHDDSCVEAFISEDNTCIEQSTSVGKDFSHTSSENITQKQTISNPLDTLLQNVLPISRSDMVAKNKTHQSENLTAYDAELENNEKCIVTLSIKPLTTVESSEQINKTLDHLINKPTTSHNNKNSADTDYIKQVPCIDTQMEHETHSTYSVNNTAAKEDLKESCIDELTLIKTESVVDTVPNNNNHNTVLSNETLENVPHQSEQLNTENMGIESKSCNDSANTRHEYNTQVPEVDFKAILENVRKQNELLTRKDERLQTLENDCSKVVNNITKTLNTGDEIIQKLESLHREHNIQNSDTINITTIQESSKENETNDFKDEGEPSTSSEIDHEARFAARDLRLKMLEEQTKSLVNKVNKTTSKGVKINYKLDELHNIYGSENSRAGTPSEDNEEKRLDDDDTQSD